MEKPKILNHPNDNNLREQLENYINGTHCDHIDCDCAHYIFEDTLRAYYGKDVFYWINKK